MMSKWFFPRMAAGHSVLTSILLGAVITVASPLLPVGGEGAGAAYAQVSQGGGRARSPGPIWGQFKRLRHHAQS